MIAAGAVEIQGIDKCIRMYDQGDKEFLAALKKASRAGANAVKRQIKRETPERFRYLVNSKVSVDKTGQIWSMIGHFNKGEASGTQPGNGRTIPDWFKAYWRNYGTLEGRDPSHTFRSKIKKIKRRNNKGQKAEHFFKNATEGWEKLYYGQMKKSLEKQGYKLNDQ